MNQHPFDGESLNYEDRLRFWDQYSDQYSGFQQGDIPRRIVDRLFEVDMLQSEDCVLEVGSGPGTYSLELAPKVRILVCMDTSPRMLDRLSQSMMDRGYSNFERFLMDWNEYEPRKGYDTCIATLCPGTGSPESIHRMECASRRGCVLVSWLTNHGDDLNAEIWKRMGKDYGYEMRSTNPAFEWLVDNGRNPQMEILRTTVSADMHIDELVAKERSAFRLYGREDEAEALTREILAPHLDGDILHYTAENAMKLIYWRV